MQFFNLSIAPSNIFEFIYSRLHLRRQLIRAWHVEAIGMLQIALIQKAVMRRW